MKTSQRYWLGGLLLAAFLLLAGGVLEHAAWLQALDSTVANSALIKPVGPLNTFLFSIIATLGSPLVAIGLTALFCVVLLLRRDWYAAIWCGGIQLGTSAIAYIVKQVVARPRPTHQLIADTGFSFPSGHVLCTTVLVLCMIWVLTPHLHDEEQRVVSVIVGVVWIGLVATSRVYLRDHFASDVIASVLLGTASWLLAQPLWAKIYSTFIESRHSHAETNHRHSSI